MKVSELPCPLCGSPCGLSVGLDRKGKPFATSWCCGLTLFAKSTGCIGGLIRLSEAMARGEFGPPDEHLVSSRQRGEAFMREILAAASSPVPAPVLPVAAPVVGPTVSETSP